MQGAMSFGVGMDQDVQDSSRLLEVPGPVTMCTINRGQFPSVGD
jgi:hypothetical protein